MAGSASTRTLMSTIQIEYPDLDSRIMEDCFLPLAGHQSLTVEETNTVYREHFSEQYTASDIPNDVAKDEPFLCIVAHLIGELTEILPLEINDIIKRDVPHQVIERCEEILNILSPLLTAARQGCSLQDCATGRMPLQFYAVLCEEIQEMLEAQEIQQPAMPPFIRTILRRLLDIAFYSTMKNQNMYNPTVSHRAWSMFLHDLVSVVSVDGHCYHNGDRLVLRTAFSRFEGLTDLGFMIKHGRNIDPAAGPAHKVIHAVPDFIIAMNEVHQVDSMNGDGINLKVTFPILVAEVKTTSTHTSSYVKVQKMGSSSASGSSLNDTQPSTSNSSGDAMDTSSTQRAVTLSATRKFSSSGTTMSDKQENLKKKKVPTATLR